jgi:hypothetical protein
MWKDGSPEPVKKDSKIIRFYYCPKYLHVNQQPSFILPCSSNLRIIHLLSVTFTKDIPLLQISRNKVSHSNVVSWD